MAREMLIRLFPGTARRRARDKTRRSGRKNEAQELPPTMTAHSPTSIPSMLKTVQGWVCKLTRHRDDQSDTYCPHLPFDLVELVIEFFRFDLPALATCSLVCRAWYGATLRHFPHRDRTYKFHQKSAFNTFARLVTSQKNRPYFGSAFHALIIVDDPMDRFGHVWTLRLPESFLAKLLYLELEAVDWRSTRLQPCFQRLSYCTNVERLGLTDCRFRNVSLLRTIINSLRGLKRISLRNITFDTPPTSSPPSLSTSSTITHGRLQEIRLRSTVDGLTDIVGPVHSQNLLNLCPRYSTITSLELDLRYFSSILHLEHFILYFHQLSVLNLGYMFNSDSGPEREFDTGTPPAYLHPRRHSKSVSHLVLDYMPAGCATQVLQLVGRSILMTTDAWLSISLADRPSADELRIFACSLQQFNTHLKYLDWKNLQGNDLDAVPCTAHNTSLTWLEVSLCLAPSRYILHRSLLHVLSNITNEHLRRIAIGVKLSHLTAPRSRSGCSLTTVDTRVSTSAFHDVLSRSVFKSWQGFSALIVINMKELRDNDAQVSAIKLHMVDLFRPWLDRDILDLEFYIGPDAPEIITHTPTS
ncbi:uncharacterized protein C8Q71DRAFT_287535 [Rhodofomes roseus]|uniref:F-box domain-containing protein n=2 Tax=Rhodofomes roseus TaxID=34475 RepID=A0ABQ8K4N5_9APHY|nr:uncharacterized protein C8Q71DRAFT_287535 [Rhodofomes roseus]KAH9831852.1 hypothetical protein C8Q71DRAFT_287535 [Rhodofomes roseus]